VDAVASDTYPRRAAFLCIENIIRRWPFWSKKQGSRLCPRCTICNGTSFRWMRGRRGMSHVIRITRAPLT